MTITAYDLLLYMVALFVLFITPGPVWVALVARAMSGGYAAAWPLAVGVTLGDMLWPLIAIFGLTWIVERFAAFMTVMHWVAAAMFVIMGLLLIRHAGKGISADSRLTRPGLWAGFATGVAAVIGNPKAILFYMGVLPGFFDLRHVTIPDIAAIIGVSVAIPLCGNLILAASVGQARALLNSPTALWRANTIAGGLMIAVGIVIGLT